MSEELTKNFLLRVKQADQVYTLFPQTTAHNVIVDKTKGETLKQRLAKIAKLLGTGDKTVAQQVAEVQTKVDAILKDAPEALDSLREIADWINNNSEDFSDIKALAAGIDEAIDAKVGDLGEYSTVKDYVEAQIAAAKSEEEIRCAQELAKESARAKAAEEANATAIGENKAAIEAEVTRAQNAEAELEKNFVVFTSLDEFDSANFNEMAAIFMPDDPVEVETEAQLVSALAGDNPGITLNNDVTISSTTAAAIEVTTDKTIDLNGYKLVVEG